jgi:hypothetical protein
VKRCLFPAAYGKETSGSLWSHRRCMGGWAIPMFGLPIIARAIQRLLGARGSCNGTPKYMPSPLTTRHLFSRRWRTCGGKVTSITCHHRLDSPLATTNNEVCTVCLTRLRKSTAHSTPTATEHSSTVQHTSLSVIARESTRYGQRRSEAQAHVQAGA